MVLLLASLASALEGGDEDLAQKSQKPVGNLINLRFENNSLFNVEPTGEDYGNVFTVIVDGGIGRCNCNGHSSFLNRSSQLENAIFVVAVLSHEYEGAALKIAFSKFLMWMSFLLYRPKFCLANDLACNQAFNIFL